MSLANLTEGPFVFDGLGGGGGPSRAEIQTIFLTGGKKQISAKISSNSVSVKQQSRKIGTKGTRYAKPTDLFKEDTFAPNGQRIAPKNLYRELNKQM